VTTAVATRYAEIFLQIVTSVSLLRRELFTWKRHGVPVGVFEAGTVVKKLFTACLSRREEASG